MKRVYNKTILFGLYDDETDLIHAVEKANTNHVEIWDCFTPFPVHGLDKVMGLKESRLHMAGFAYGLTGTSIAFLFMSWAFAIDWQIVFGGKSFWPVPAFIPITFELTVLLSAVGMTITYYLINGLWPGVENPILHPRITDDKFCIAFDVTGASTEELGKVEEFLRSTHPTEVQTKSI